MTTQKIAESAAVEAQPTNPCDEHSPKLATSIDAGRFAQLATPVLAHAWVSAIMLYWQAGIANGTIIATKPLYLLDLAPRHGKLAWLILAELHRRLAAAGLALQPCYIACCQNSESAADTQHHGCFAPYAAQGSFDLARFDVANAALHLRRQAITLLRPDNPIVVLGLDYFQTLPSDLFAVHYGKVLKGLVTLDAETDHDNNVRQTGARSASRLNYAWHELDRADLPPYAPALIDHYMDRCGSAALLLPLAACGVLDALHKFAAGRTLLLAADHGCGTGQQIRLGALYPPETWPHDGGTVPLNIHALGLHQRRQGAWTWHQQLDDAGFVLHAACCDPSNAIDEHAAEAIAAALASAHPDDHGQLLAAASSASPAGLLAMLRLSRYDPQVLKAGIGALLDAPPALTELVRRNWQSALANTWNNYLPIGDGDMFYYDAGLLAAQLGSWGLAKSCFQVGLALYGDHANDLYALACCEAATGNAGHAATLLARSLQLDPSHQHSIDLQHDITGRMRRRAACTWYLPHDASATGLRLEPLGPEHAASLLYQYRDAQIGVLTRMPAITTQDDAMAWIREQQDNTAQASFAVLHQDWGFVGCVSSHCVGAAGYFHFWIGSDFQDRGLGQDAAALLFGMLEAKGVRQQFTSAYASNQRSLHALERLGFVPLQVRALDPDQDLVFLHRTAHQPDTQRVARRLRALCKAICSPFHFMESSTIPFEQ